MARAKGFENSIALFPFLNVLTCTIGVLALLVTLLSIGHVKGESEQALTVEELVPAVSESIEELEGQVDATRTEIDRMRDLLDHAASIRRIFTELSKLNRKREDVREMQARLVALLEAIRLRENEIAHAPEPGEVRIVPRLRLAGTEADDAGDHAPTPTIFAECFADEILLHPSGRRIKKDELASSRTFGGVLERTQRDGEENARLVLLVRSSGVKTFDAARARIVKNGNVRYGYLPVPGDGPMDLSAFFSDDATDRSSGGSE